MQNSWKGSAAGNSRQSSRTYALMTTLMLVLLQTSALLAESWTNVLVILDSGWKYEGVSVEKIKDDFAIDVISPDGSRKRVHLAHVQAVYDQSGKNISAEIFGDLVRTSDAQSPSEPPIDYASPGYLAEQNLRFSLSIGAGLGSASGEWYDGFTTGPLLSVGCHIVLIKGLFVGAQYRHQYMGVLDELEGERYWVDNSGVFHFYDLDLTVSFDEVYGTVGILSRPFDQRQMFFHIEAGAGNVRQRVKTVGSATNAVATNVRTQNKLGLYLSGGATFPIKDRLSLTFGVNCRLSGGRLDYTDGTSENTRGALMGFEAAITILVGK